MTTSEASTGVAPGFVDDDGNSSIVIISGANLLLTPSDIQSAAPLISNSKVVLCQLEITVESTLEALKLAKKHGGTFGVTNSLESSPMRSAI